jgi:hypothetical protein
VTISYLIDEAPNSPTMLILQGEFDKLCWRRFSGRNVGIKVDHIINFHYVMTLVHI